MDRTEMATSAADMLDAAKIIIEVVAGYRAAAMAAGFSEHAAEHMAMDYHRRLIDQISAP